jgi:hypothetical protein
MRGGWRVRTVGAEPTPGFVPGLSRLPPPGGRQRPAHPLWSGFVRDSRVLWNGVERTPTYVDHGTLRLSFEAGDLEALGEVGGRSPEPSPGGGTSVAHNVRVVPPHTCTVAGPRLPRPVGGHARALRALLSVLRPHPAEPLHPPRPLRHPRSRPERHVQLQHGDRRGGEPERAPGDGRHLSPFPGIRRQPGAGRILLGHGGMGPGASLPDRGPHSPGELLRSRGPDPRAAGRPLDLSRPGGDRGGRPLRRGQYVHRFASGSPVEAEVSGLRFRYVVANPSTFLYLGPERPDGSGGFAVPERGDCPDFNDWHRDSRTGTPT